jgi:putative phosphoesterase
MKVLIVSDTHGRGADYSKLIRKIAPMDLVIHCGDLEGQEHEIEAVTRQVCGCPAVMVAGNNDFFSSLKNEVTLELEGHKILVTHGHSYYVSMGPEFIRQEAKARGYDMVFYGHTHKPLLDQTDPEITLLNPGSLGYPRQEGRLPSYAVMTIEPDGYTHFSICYIDRDFYG